MVLGFTKTMMVNGKRKPTDFEEKIKKGIKLHTVRWDDKDRWKLGMKIHFATDVRSSRYNCFKEGVCKGTQKIAIEDDAVYVDGIQLTESELTDFAVNDGFDSVSDFWDWFNQYQPFKGKIIHWTNILY